MGLPGFAGVPGMERRSALRPGVSSARAPLRCDLSTAGVGFLAPQVGGTGSPANRHRQHDTGADAAGRRRALHCEPWRPADHRRSRSRSPVEVKGRETFRGGDHDRDRRSRAGRRREIVNGDRHFQISKQTKLRRRGAKIILKKIRTAMLQMQHPRSPARRRSASVRQGELLVRLSIDRRGDQRCHRVELLGLVGIDDRVDDQLAQSLHWSRRRSAAFAPA